MPRQKSSKVQFNPSGKSLSKVGVGVDTPPGSENNAQRTSVLPKKKSKKSRTTNHESEESDENEDNVENQYIPLSLAKLDDEVSDGSISDEEVPKVKWPPNGNTQVCPISQENRGSHAHPNQCGIRLTSSQKISPCLRSDEQSYSTTDYTKASAPLFIPPLLHSIDGQVSTFTKHREFTNYLRKSGCLKLFGACVLSVYRMWKWPLPENLMEQMINAMGYQVPARKRVEELTKLKHSLHHKLRELAKQKGKLMEKLDEYQDSAVRYALLDQDDILPPKPDHSYLNMELMKVIFKRMKFLTVINSGESSDLKIVLPTIIPDTFLLPIPYHDKRMLQ